MSGPVSVVDIPVRLEEPGRIFVFESDEAVLLFLPIIVGMATKNLITGLIAGPLLYVLWIRIKSAKGYYGLHAMRYWFLPMWANRLNALPSSAVTRWGG